jgi:hypothetical protein
METLFGVVNIPNVVWIDEQGLIVRPAEPGWPGGRAELPTEMFQALPRLGRAPRGPKGDKGITEIVDSGQSRQAYPEAIRDWVANGSASRFALTPEEIVARSRPRPMTRSEAAAHFELGKHLWRAGDRERAIEHFKATHRLEPDNWTYKRQAWSLVAQERTGGLYGRMAQGPLEGREDEWPFDSDLRSDMSVLGAGEYYPKTLD